MLSCHVAFQQLKYKFANLMSFTDLYNLTFVDKKFSQIALTIRMLKYRTECQSDPFRKSQYWKCLMLNAVFPNAKSISLSSTLDIKFEQDFYNPEFIKDVHGVDIPHKITQICVNSPLNFEYIEIKSWPGFYKEHKRIFYPQDFVISKPKNVYPPIYCDRTRIRVKTKKEIEMQIYGTMFCLSNDPITNVYKNKAILNDFLVENITKFRVESC